MKYLALLILTTALLGVTAATPTPHTTTSPTPRASAAAATTHQDAARSPAAAYQAAYEAANKLWGDWVGRQCRALGDAPVLGRSYISPDSEEYEGGAPARYLGSQGFVLHCGTHTWKPTSWESEP